MHDVYIDEKGPQEHIRVNSTDLQGKRKNDPSNRFKIGNDNMTDYVMAAIDIPNQNSDVLKSRFEELETNYLLHSENSGELKGAQVLKGKKFQYGIGSMPTRETRFYTSLIELLMSQDVKLCLVTQRKTASIITQRLHFWILEAAKREKVSYITLAYTLAKYATNEASGLVLQELQNSDKTVYQILSIIKADLRRFIREHKNVARMQLQNGAFSDVLKIIGKSQNIKTNDTAHSGEFEWGKVDYSLSLWLEERQLLGEDDSYRLFLDEGIRKDVFSSEHYSDIREDCNSKEIYGIRIADFMATIFGKMISKLALATLYNPEEPGNTVYLSEEWFFLNQEQLKLGHLLYQFSMDTGLQYSFNNDTFFDDAIALQAYLTYVNEFSDSEHLKQEGDGFEEFKIYQQMAQQRFALMATVPHYLGEDSEQAISAGLIKPF